MKSSKYNIVIASPTDEKTHLLYNTLYDHQLIITDNSYRLADFFEKVNGGERLSVEEEEAALNLKELGIIVDNDLDEVEVFEKWFKEKIQDSTDLFSATIFTTLNCNLRCTYCLEKDLIRPVNMNRETMDNVVMWLSRQIDIIHPARVHLEFFGGEPLLNIEAIETIGGIIYNLCGIMGIEFSIGMATNGVLLAPEIVDKLLRIGLKRIKVTLDGDREDHDLKRIYPSGMGTFDTIFKNLEDNAGKLKIFIGGNFNSVNLPRIPNLIDILKDCKFRNDIAHVTFKPIIEDFGRKFLENFDQCDISSFADKDVEAMFHLRELVQKAGLPTFDQIAIGPCEFYRRNSVSIDIDGNIFNCPAFVGREKFIAGNVNNNKFTEEGERQLTIKPWQNKKECSSCPFLPICAGGCRATAWNDSKQMGTVSCDRRFFDMMVKSIIAKNGFASGPAEK